VKDGGIMMKKKLAILKAIITENKLLLETNGSLHGLIPAEQILVDSEQCTFIYLLEDQEDYTYIVLPEGNWPMLKAAKEKEIPVWVTNKDEQIELKNFQEELEYVINNIKGNSNYGEDMVMQVEAVF